MEAMSGKNEREDRKALLRFADELIDDILAASDEEVLAEFKDVYGDPLAFANAMRAKTELLFVEANKDRLDSARQKLAADKQSRSILNTKINVDAARRALASLFSRPPGSVPLTLAARKEKVSEMSDDDVLGMIADLETLGFQVRIKNGEKNG